ncbi:hypothetical protein NQ317_008275 [Molorchus minor]|uniref:Uncharacterized protein n=1 Tax=Molorchus minor TaxID=1323400 RepID=A0ABQ9J838_9CUCU|nr:hypothetical protein NQ317_008275 [Molorchus minor]
MNVMADKFGLSQVPKLLPEMMTFRTTGMRQLQHPFFLGSLYIQYIVITTIRILRILRAFPDGVQQVQSHGAAF